MSPDAPSARSVPREPSAGRTDVEPAGPVSEARGRPIGRGGSPRQAEGLMRGALHGTFFALLAVALVQAVADEGGPRVALPAVLLGAVYAAGVLRDRASQRAAVPARPSGGRRIAWLAVVSALWLVLLALDADFAYLAFPLFFLYLHLLPPRWSLPATAAATAAVIAGQAGQPGPLTAAMVIGPVAGATVAVLISGGYAALYRESRARQHLIDDLVRTRDELAAAQREAGKLAERQRLAREIHDTLAQGLSSIVLLSRVAASGDESVVRARLAEIGETAAGNLAEARRFVQELAPPALADASLPEALRRVADAAPLDVAFRLDGEPYPLPVEAEVALLRLTQEALANVTRHAGTDRAAVTLAFLDGQVALDVFDEGRGFDTATSGGGRFGLRGMRERIAGLGGTLTVESAPGEGTAVAAVLPRVAP